MSVDLFTHYAITDYSSYAVYADARIGDNGSEYGMGEQSVGSSGSGTAGFQVWDSDPWDGIFMDSVQFEMHIRAGGGEDAITWQIGESTVLTYDAPQYGDISSVLLQAAVGASGAAFEFADVELQFRNDGQDTELTQLNDPLLADTTSTGDAIEKVAIVTPTSSTNDEVIITGTLRFRSMEGSVAWGTDVFGKIMIYTA